ncbi:MAG: glutathione peroxidase [Bdellovibrio sp. ArHS]|uniref:glutathione peroxidase n=1 Tax=Bdellovibrio sp. ArHS TaxID=1569284 RepID=UPI000582A306|nr:glutathione peroxidase [Bdellovibrio sp. ArHS]KHD89682.1 MAG: glutathione peroxidase [Bdellovibrio sp. ArHS]
MEKTLHSFTVKAADGSDVPLDKYKGQAVLVVNVASKCGFTPQYAGLEELYEKFKDQGFTVLGFPCNQFGAQEPGSDSDIQQFCSLTYNVKFPVMAKIDVNGDNADPLYKWMKESAPGFLGTEMIKWNFTKFLIGKDGKILKRYPPQEEPKNLTEDIKAAIK